MTLIIMSVIGLISLTFLEPGSKLGYFWQYASYSNS